MTDTDTPKYCDLCDQEITPPSETIEMNCSAGYFEFCGKACRAEFIRQIREIDEDEV